MTGEKMRRVTKQDPCPVCGKSDWCLAAPDGSAAICQRIEEGSKKRCGEAGWLHILRDDRQAPKRRPCRRAIPLVAAPQAKDFGMMAGQCSERLTPEALGGLADELGVSVQSLRRLGVGWNGAGFTFPMRDATGDVIGLRIRYNSRFKAAQKGSRNGLFIPADLPDGGPLLICEGPTDTAAALDLGFAAVGRASCNTGGRMLAEFARGRDVVIVGDDDAPGRRGAVALAEALLLGCTSVRVIYPTGGAKDLRAWKASGLTREQVQVVMTDAPRRTLAVRRARA